MADQHVHLLEGAFVEQMGDSFPGGELALLVLAVDCPAAPGVERLFSKLA